MKTKFIAVANQKGGVGKTSSTINLSHALANRKKKVLIVDGDRQGHASNGLIDTPTYDLSVSKTLGQLFIGKTSENDVNDLVRPAVMRDKVVDNLYLIPSHPSLQRIFDAKLGAVHRERILLKHFKKLDKSFDYVIFDTSPDASLGNVNTIVMADIVLVPIDGSKYAADGLADLLDLIDEIKDGDECPIGVFRNEFDKRNSKINKFLESELGEVNDKLLTTVIRTSQDVVASSLENETLFISHSGANVAQDFKDLATEIINHPALQS